MHFVQRVILWPNFSQPGDMFLAGLQTFSYSKVIDNFLHSLQNGKEENNLKEVKNKENDMP